MLIIVTQRLIRMSPVNLHLPPMSPVPYTYIFCIGCHVKEREEDGPLIMTFILQRKTAKDELAKLPENVRSLSNLYDIIKKYHETAERIYFFIDEAQEVLVFQYSPSKCEPRVTMKINTGNECVYYSHRDVGCYHRGNGCHHVKEREEDEFKI